MCSWFNIRVNIPILFKCFQRKYKSLSKSLSRSISASGIETLITSIPKIELLKEKNN